jgi:predicted MFS family arabinose efflux permease
MAIVSRLARGKIHYGWYMAAVTFLTVMVAAGARSAPGVMIIPLEHEFGWSRATISFAVSTGLLLYGLIAPFAASVLERFGVRTVASAAMALIAIGYGTSALFPTPWSLVLLWGILAGSGCGFTATVLSATVATRWFDARRGLVMGMLTSATAGGQLVFLPLLAWITAEWGWRDALLLISGIGLVVILPLALTFMRDRPYDVGLARFGSPTPPEPPKPATGNPIANAFRVLFEVAPTANFWKLGGTFFVCGFSTNGLIGTHLIPACVDNGIPEVTAAGLLAGMGMFNFVGTSASGWLADRFNNRRLLCSYYVMRGLALLYLPFLLNDVSFTGLSIFALFYGLDWLATVAPMVRLIGAVYEPSKTSIIYGWIFVLHQVGGAISAALAGLMRTELGAYQESFWMAGFMCIGAGLLALTVRRKDPNSGLGVPVDAAAARA